MPPDGVDAFLAMARAAALTDDSARVEFAVGTYRFLFAAGPAAVPLPGKVKDSSGRFVAEGDVARLPGSAEGEPGPPAPVLNGGTAPTTVAGAIDLYLNSTKAEAHPPTWENLRYVLRRFAAAHGTMLIGDAKPYHLKLWVDGQPQWKSDWTKKRVIGSVKVAFGWCKKLGVIDINPFAGTPTPKGERGDAVEPAEFQAMLRNSTAIFRRVLIFQKFSGARPGEMAKTEWPHVQLAESRIVLTKHKTAKRTGRPRKIMLHPVAVKLIEWIKRHRPHPKFVFTNSKGWEWSKSGICWRIKECRKTADVRTDTTLYGCRHKWVNDLIVNGVDLPTVAELAGHTNINTTMHYSHVGKDTEHLKNALNNLSTTERKRDRSCQS